MMLTLRQVEAFKALMECGTVLRAADHMALSQPAVSRLIADLEHGVGYRLFDRRKGRIVPRREADELYDEVLRSFVGLASIADAAQRIGRKCSGQFRVAALPAFDCPLTARVIGRFLDAHPDVYVTLVARTHPAIVQETAAGLHDIAIATLPAARSDAGVHTVIRSQYELLVPSGHPLAAQETIDLADLEGVDLIVPANPGPVQREFDRRLDAAGVRNRRRLETTTAQMGHALVSEGLGVCLIIRPLFTHLASGCVRTIPFAEPLSVEIAVLHPPGRPPDSVAEHFVALFAEALQPGRKTDREPPSRDDLIDALSTLS